VKNRCCELPRFIASVHVFWLSNSLNQQHGYCKFWKHPAHALMLFRIAFKTLLSQYGHTYQVAW